MRAISIHSCVFILCAAIAAPAAADPADEIAAASATFDDAFNSGDPAQIAANFTEDAIALSPGWKFVSGRDKVETMFSAFMKAGFGDKVSTTESLEIVSDDAAIEVLWDEVSRSDKSGAIHREYSKILRTWRKEADGVWRIHRWAWNDLPR